MSGDEIEVINTSVAQEEISPENHQRRESNTHSDDIIIRDVGPTTEACGNKRRGGKWAEASRRYRQRKNESKPPKPPAKTAAVRSKTYRERKKLLRSAAAEAITPAPIPSKKRKIIPSSTCTSNLSSPNAAQIHHQHSLPMQHNIPQNSIRQQQNRNLQKKTNASEINFDEIQKATVQGAITTQPNYDDANNANVDVQDNRELPNRESQSDLDSDMDTEEHSDGPPIEFDDDFVPPYSGYMNRKFAHKQFQKMFVENPFGYACSVCDRLWFEKDLKEATSAEETMLKKITALTNIADAKLCTTCKRSMQKEKIPTLSAFNGFRYPEKSAYLPQLNIIAERLISPRLPFMQIRRKKHVNGQFCITGQIINVPVSVDNMVSVLPRNVDDDLCINVHITKKLIHKLSHFQGFVKKNEIKSWLRYLVNQPMYKLYDITINNSFLANIEQDTQIDYTPVQESSPQMLDHRNARPVVNINELSEHIPIEESLVAQQQTLLWNEDKFLQIAPSENNLSQDMSISPNWKSIGGPKVIEKNVTPHFFECQMEDEVINALDPLKICNSNSPNIIVRQNDGNNDEFILPDDLDTMKKQRSSSINPLVRPLSPCLETQGTQTNRCETTAKGTQARPKSKNVCTNTTPSTCTVGTACSLWIDDSPEIMNITPMEAYEEKAKPNETDIILDPCNDEITRGVCKEEIIPEDEITIEDRAREMEILNKTIFENTTRLLIEENPLAFIGMCKNDLPLIDDIFNKSEIPKQTIYIIMQKLRLNIPNAILSGYFGLSEDSILPIIRKDLPKLSKYMSNWIVWPTSNEMRLNLPGRSSDRYGSIQSIIDIFDIHIDKPKPPITKFNKSDHIKKYLISITPDGIINFLSNGFNGSITDIEIIENSEYLNFLPDGVAVLSDCIYKNIEILMQKKRCTLVKPPILLVDLKSTEREKNTIQVSCARDYVQKIVKRLREFRFFEMQYLMTDDLLPNLDQAVIVAAALVNMQTLRAT